MSAEPKMLINSFEERGAIGITDVLQAHYFRFDSAAAGGSKEHYWHFMWGYLLPALHEITSKPLNYEPKEYLLESCGPLMDRLTAEMFSLWGLNFEIVQKRPELNNGECIETLLPRWDAEIWRFSSWRHRLSVLRRIREESVFAERVLRLRSILLDQVRNVNINGATNDLINNYLVLQRSPEHEYYKLTGSAEIPTYGSARRALTGVEEALTILRSMNLPVSAFEPGKCSLTEQIRVFDECKGIVGVRGAEFANMLWMKAGSKVILVRPREMRTPSMQRTLARLLALKYCEIVVNDGPFPRLDPRSVGRFLLR